MVTYYQCYRKALKETGSPREADEVMNKILPGSVYIRTLKFFQEVKTSKPIPWIVEFEDVTEIKPEIQRKMLNELTEAFKKKDFSLIQLGAMLDEVADEIPPDKTKDVLLKINTKKVRVFEALLAEEEAKPKEHKTNGSDSATDEVTISDSIHETEGAETSKNKEASVSPSGFLIDQHGRLRFDPSSVLLTSGSDFLFNPLGQSNLTVCEKCGKHGNLPSHFGLSDLGFNDFNTCKVCGRTLCKDCFSLVDYYSPYQCCSDCNGASEITSISLSSIFNNSTKFFIYK